MPTYRVFVGFHLGDRIEGGYAVSFYIRFALYHAVQRCYSSIYLSCLLLHASDRLSRPVRRRKTCTRSSYSLTLLPNIPNHFSSTGTLRCTVTTILASRVLKALGLCVCGIRQRPALALGESHFAPTSGYRFKWSRDESIKVKELGTRSLITI